MTNESKVAIDRPLNTKLACRLSARCSGCDRIEFDRLALEADRLRDLKSLGLGDVPVSFEWIGAGGLRDRLEFTLEGNTFGLFERRAASPEQPASRTIVDIDTCPQLSPSLQSWLSEFRRDLPEFAARPRGSVRLRVAPDGAKGAWLDLSNEDIRDLLEDGRWLARQLAKGVVVEVGQKRKRVVTTTEGPRAHRLVDPVLAPWFETLKDEHETTPLFATIGTFTQPGFKAQATLIRAMREKIRSLALRKPGAGLAIAEFGCGIGAFTLPLLATGAAVDVFEFDRLALEALQRGVEAAGLEASRLRIFAGDFIQSNRAFDAVDSSREYDLVVVDPPRPGLGKFLEAIDSRAKKASWIYVSCFPESFARDARALAERGLTLDSITVVEQFPFTHHFEIVAAFRR